MIRSSLLLPVLALGLMSAGCSGDTNLVRDVAVASGVTGGEPKPAPDFVSRSRSTQVDYMPVGVAPERRAPRAKDAAAVKAAEAELTAARTRNEARGAEARRAGAASPAAAPVKAPPPAPTE